MKTYSFSKISQYGRCPLSYKKLNLLKESQVDKGSMIQGKIAHKILELGFKVKNLPLIMSMVLKDKDEDLHNFDLVKEISSDLEPLISSTTFYENCIGVEIPIILTLGPYELRGYIDRLDKSEIYKIIDYKFGNYEYQKDQLDKSLQLLLYAYYVMTKYNVKEVEIEYFNLKQDSRISRVVHWEEFNPDEIISLISSIESAEMLDSFPPILSGNCMYCSVRLSCDPFLTWIKANTLEDPSPDISLEEMIEHFYNIQEKERAFKKQRLKLQEIITEIMKNEGQKISGYSLSLNRYGYVEIKKS